MLETSHYDEATADYVVNFIGCLCHTKGRWAGKPFDLLPWQEQIIRDIFGTLKPNGKRQFTTAYIEIPKKNGKSELAAAVALYLLFGDGEVYNVLKIGEDDHGGYLVPDEYERQLIDALQEQNIFRQLAHVISTSSGDRKIPVVRSHGTAAWIDENAAYPESDDTFGQISISAFKLATTIKVSDELLHDSVFDVPSYIAKEFARRIGSAEEEAFFVGDGAGKPTGILNDKDGAQVGITTGSATAVTFDDVMDLFYSLRAPYRRSAVFIMNDSTVKALRKLKNGSGDYIWQPSVTAGTPDTILNRPVYTSPFVPVLGSAAKPILFGDMNYYWVADREGRRFQRLNELYAPNGQVGFLSSERVDGKLILPEAVKCLQMKA